MADLATSAVTLNRDWYVGIKREVRSKDLTLVLTGQGTTANKITASALGFTKLLGPVALTKSDNTEVVLGNPNFDGTVLLLLGTTAVDDNGDIIVTTEPTDITGTFRGVVTGI